MIRIGLVGLGKMGLSQLAILGGDPRVDVVGGCDSTGYLRDVLNRNTSVPVYAAYEELIREARPDGVIISTPNSYHFSMVRDALERGLHVFCEKPLTLAPQESEELAELAAGRGLVAQVGYHNRFVGTFAEVKRLLELGAIGNVSHALAEAYGPVVLRPKGGTWRSRRGEGGGCLYDYAAHPLNLLQWYFGESTAARGVSLKRIFSHETDDQVTGTLDFCGGVTSQLCVNWSDESTRKMTTRLTIRGDRGRIQVERQDLHVYINREGQPPEGYSHGHNMRYATDLSPQVGFYLRGEEYSAQLEHFIDMIEAHGTPGRGSGISGFADGAATDRMIAQVLRAAESPEAGVARGAPGTSRPTRSGSRIAKMLGFSSKGSRRELVQEVAR